MLGKGITVSEATHRWVQEFNRFPQDMIEKLMMIDADSWHEVTKPSSGRRMYVFNLPEEKPDGTPYEGNEHCGKISECVDDDTYIVELDDGESVMVKEDDLELDEYNSLPMWGTMWQFGDSADDYWLEEMDGIRIMSECGFRIYESDEWGYFFGIDGCGYDFYEAHWIPLYRKRGLQWHDPATELTEETVSGMLKEFIEDEKLIEKLLKLRKGDSINVGGYYGGFLKKEQAQKLDKVGWFDVDFRHETVQEMSSKQDNDYYVISKEV